MFAVTHAAIAVTAAAAALGISDPISVAIAAAASQLPDVDTTKSIAGRIVWPLANWLEQKYPHRSVTHSFVATGAMAIAGLPLGHWGNWHWWGCLTIGYFAGWFADSFTRSGVEAFWPGTARLVIPGNPRARLTSGSKAEYWLLGITMALALTMLNLNSEGGFTELIGRGLVQQTSTTVELLGKFGSGQVIWVEVTGSHRQTGERIEGQRFQALEPLGSGILALSEDGGLYAIGEAESAQIFPQRVKSSLGETLIQESKISAPQEVPADEFLAGIGADSYLSGFLELDDLEDVQISRSLEEYPRIRVEANQLILTWCKPEDLEAAIADFWIIKGEVISRSRTIAPNS
jgi:inner membrane protein